MGLNYHLSSVIGVVEGLHAFTTGNPFSGTKILEFSIGRGFGPSNTPTKAGPSSPVETPAKISRRYFFIGVRRDTTPEEEHY